MSNENNNQVGELLETIDALTARIETLEEVQEETLQKVEAVGSSLTVGKSKTQKLERGEFTSGKKTRRFKYPRLRAYSESRKAVIDMPTAEVVKDKELLAEIVKTYPHLIEDIT